MRVKAVTKNCGVSARKVRLVMDTVRGKRVDEALVLLKFTPTPTARLVAKTVKSAAANAENNFQMIPADLKVVDIQAGVGPTVKRFRPRSRGQANPILKRTSHITVIVADEEI